MLGEPDRRNVLPDEAIEAYQTACKHCGEAGTVAEAVTLLDSIQIHFAGGFVTDLKAYLA